MLISKHGKKKLCQNKTWVSNDAQIRQEWQNPLTQQAQEARVQLWRYPRLRDAISEKQKDELRIFLLEAAETLPRGYAEVVTLAEDKASFLLQAGFGKNHDGNAWVRLHHYVNYQQRAYLPQAMGSHGCPSKPNPVRR